MTPGQPNAPASEDSHESVEPSPILELNFVPDWARKPPAADPYAGHVREERPPRRDHRDGPRRDQRGGNQRGGNRPGGQQRGDRGPRPEGRGDRRPREGGRRDDRSQPRREHHERRPPLQPLPPIQVSFVPEQERLAAMVNDIRASQHAFPLPELAHLFLNQPEWHFVKFESNKVTGGAYAISFYQSKLSGLLFLNEGEALDAAADEALAQCFVAEVEQREPPSGNFVVVSRCRLSGALLGPPNHHGFNEQVDALYRSRFAHMSLDEYRRNIETVRDPELIEKWKESFRTHTVYRLKSENPDAEPAAAMDEKQARQHAREQIAPQQVAQVKRAILPGRASRSIADAQLLRLLRAAWEREQRFPVTLIRALRGAFKRMGLYSFEAGGKSVFVTAIQPKPVDPQRVVETIREVLEWLKAHPGATRSALIQAVRPDAGDDPAKLTEVMQPLTWLVEKGHVIEFHNGTLAVPHGAPEPEPPAAAE